MTALHLIRLLNEAGWYEVRQKGSHKIFKHDEKITTLVVRYAKLTQTWTVWYLLPASTCYLSSRFWWV
jgi:hypothetical protein